VANRADGSVSVIAEGPGEALDRLAEELERGPVGARVQRVDLRRGPAAGELEGFRIRSGSHRGD
jgi:acylphosphatase